MPLLRYKLPNAAPQISRRWPLADAAFSASALAGTRYYDLAKRAWYEFNPNASVGVGRGLSGASLKPVLDSANGQNKLRDITRDLDTDTCIWTFTFSVDAGSITSSLSGARFLLFDGTSSSHDVHISIRSTGLMLRAGSLAADVSILALADLPREKPLTISVLAGDTDVQVWLNGTRLYAGTPSQLWHPQNAQSFSAYVNSGTGSEAFINVQQAATWTNNVSLDMARRLSFGPQELFEPSQIWVPVSSGGGYTHPTLSNARMGSLTSTTGVPMVDYTF